MGLFPTFKKNSGGGGGCRYVHQVMGVCCIVFDIDGMLFEFFMNFFNIEKYKILKFFFKISCFLRVSCYFKHIKKKMCQKKFGGGGGCYKIFFFLKTILSHFTFYTIFNINK